MALLTQSNHSLASMILNTEAGIQTTMSEKKILVSVVLQTHMQVLKDFMVQ